MKVAFDNAIYDFRPWKPSMGRVFARTFAFDCETTLIDESRSWLSPAYVIGAGFDGKHGVFVRREDVAGFFGVHADREVVFHNASFDLAVINTLVPTLDIYSWV